MKIQNSLTTQNNTEKEEQIRGTMLPDIKQTTKLQSPNIYIYNTCTKVDTDG